MVSAPKRALVFVLLACFVLGGPTGCVTAAMFETVFRLDEEIDDDPAFTHDQRPPRSAGWFLSQIGLAGLLLPVTLSADIVIGICFGWLIYDDNDEDEDEEPYYFEPQPSQRPPPRPHPLTLGPPGREDCAAR